jgi:hypothetical protein
MDQNQLQSYFEEKIRKDSESDEFIKIVRSCGVSSLGNEITELQDILDQLKQQPYNPASPPTPYTGGNPWTTTVGTEIDTKTSTYEMDLELFKKWTSTNINPSIIYKWANETDSEDKSLPDDS